MSKGPWKLVLMSAVLTLAPPSLRVTSSTIFLNLLHIFDFRYAPGPVSTSVFPHLKLEKTALSSLDHLDISVNISKSNSLIHSKCSLNITHQAVVIPALSPAPSLSLARSGTCFLIPPLTSLTSRRLPPLCLFHSYPLQSSMPCSLVSRTHFSQRSPSPPVYCQVLTICSFQPAPNGEEPARQSQERLLIQEM